MIARQLIQEEVLPLLFTETVSQALVRMDDYKVSHFPVVDQGFFQGVVVEKELLGLADISQPISPEIIHYEDFYINDDQIVYDLLALVSKQKLSIIPVIDAENHYLGCITISSLLGFLSHSLSADSPGGVIVLEVSEVDYSLTEIANIIESNNAKILNVLLLSGLDSTRLTVIIKVNLINISFILRTFDRYKYNVWASFGEDIGQEDMKENYDSLMNYLKM
ncbi:MAG: CBS domain-containing protein [Bacteroidales bacterium]|nr:CBS domain-containing protein [Bacteroidales bacterium]